MCVSVVRYDPYWPVVFKAIRDSLLALIDPLEVVSIDHVGSTSVPGLAAKPIIDIDIVITAASSETLIPELIKALTSEGTYEYVGEAEIPERHAFKYNKSLPTEPGIVDAERMRRNLYVCIQGSLALKNHLIVRDYLRRNSLLAEHYGLIKMELADRELVDIEEYGQGKNAVLQRILKLGGMSKKDLAEIEQLNTFR